ncbi:MAG: hypothetical protein K8S55_00695 [Phycisphaerae bacterium]|nr:hypothetical protein [Phycisphaerae bacterium]
MKQRIFVAGLCGIVVMLAVGVSHADGDKSVKLNKPVPLGFAGIKIAFPAECRRQLSWNPLGIYVGHTSRGKKWQAVQLFAVPSRKPFADQANQAVAEKMAKEFIQRGQKTKNEKSKITITKEAKWGKRVGWQVVVERNHGKKTGTIFVITTWTEAFKNPKKYMQYVLQVELSGQDVARARAIADKIVNSAKKIKLQPHWELPLELPTIPITDWREGFGLKIPATWHLKHMGRKPKSKNKVFTAAAVDFIGRGSPNVSLTVGRGLTYDVHSDKYIKVRTAVSPKMKAMNWKLKSTRKIKLAGQNALEIIVTVKQKDRRFILIQVQAVWDKKMYTLTVCYPATQEKRAMEMTGNILKSFKFLKPPPAKPAKPAAPAKKGK